jgi:hypothetical protein
MKHIGGRPGPKISIYKKKKTTFSFFFFLSGEIRMTVTKGKKERAVIFSTLEDFEKHSVEKGLPSEFLGTISRAYQ